jgi:hypothetical protein
MFSILVHRDVGLSAAVAKRDQNSVTVTNPQEDRTVPTNDGVSFGRFGRFGRIPGPLWIPPPRVFSASASAKENSAAL